MPDTNGAGALFDMLSELRSVLAAMENQASEVNRHSHKIAPVLEPECGNCDWAKQEEPNTLTDYVAAIVKDAHRIQESLSDSIVTFRKYL